MNRFKKSAVYPLAILGLLASLDWAQEREKRISLEDCILAALRNNLGVAAAVLTPQQAGLSVVRATEKFLPQLAIGYDTSSNNSASFSWIDAAQQVTTAYKDYSFQVNELIPTGGTVSVSLSSYKNETNRSFQTINPRYGSTLSLNLYQPLLRNFGIKTNRSDIIIAQNNRDISENQFRKLLVDTIYNVEEAYWNLVYSIENLKVMKRSLQLAQDLLTKNQREVSVGTLAPIEVLSAQAEVANREAAILKGEAMIKNNEDILRTIINLPPEEAGEGMTLIPTEQPSYFEKPMSFEEALGLAKDHRPDYAASLVDLKNRELTVTYVRNQLLPDLALRASYWSPGVSGTQILYQDNNPLTGVVIGTVPSGSSAALKDAINLKYSNWSIGLVLSVPLYSVISRAEVAQAKLDLEQANIRLKNQEQQIELEIKTSLRDVETNYKSVQAYKLARDLALKKLEAEEKKLKVGLTTNYFVLLYQRDLADAHSAEIRALIDYNLSLSRLDRALGTSLQNRNIKFSSVLEKTF